MRVFGDRCVPARADRPCLCSECKSGIVSTVSSDVLVPVRVLDLGFALHFGHSPLDVLSRPLLLLDQGMGFQMATIVNSLVEPLSVHSLWLECDRNSLARQVPKLLFS